MIKFQISKTNFTVQRGLFALLSLVLVAGAALTYTGPNRPNQPSTRWRGRACGNINGGNYSCCNAYWDGAQNQFRQSVCGGWASPNDCDCRDFLNGNFTSSSVAPVNGGAQPPATHSGSFSCANPGSGGWCISGPSIDFSADEPLSSYIITSIEGDSGILCGINAQSGSCSWAISYPDGAYTENHWAQSTLGDTSGLRTTNYRIDGTPPTISESVPAPDGQNGWYVTPPTVSVTGTDVTSGFDRGEVQDGGWTNSPHTITGDGSHSINFRTFDVAGNVTTGGSTTINLDTTAPTVSPQVSGTISNGYYGKSVDITVNGSDATSGIAFEEVNIDGGGWQPDGNYVLSDGDHTIQFRATDQAGNSSIGNLTISVDGSDPSPNVSSGAGACVNGIHTFHGQIREEQAGLAVGNFLLDGSVMGPLNLSSDNTWTFDLNTEKEGDGIYLVSAYAEDVAGNGGTAPAVNVMIDNTSPFISLWDSWDSTSYGVLSIEDQLAGIQKVEIIFKADELNRKFGFNGDSYPGTINLAEFLGNVTLEPGAEIDLSVLAYDNCENKSEAIAKINVVAPPAALAETVEKESEEPAEEETEPEEQQAVTQSIEPIIDEVPIEEGSTEFLPPLTEPEVSGIATRPIINWRIALPSLVIILGSGITALMDPRPAAYRKRTQILEEWFENDTEIFIKALDEL